MGQLYNTLVTLAATVNNTCDKTKNGKAETVLGKNDLPPDKKSTVKD